MIDLSQSPLPDDERAILSNVPLNTGHMLELGSKQFGRYKGFFQKDFAHTSVDLNGLGGALPLDLTKPLDLGEFDIITNFGTTEHVSDQRAVWANILKSLKVGGYFATVTPYPGDWSWHGRFYPTPAWYQSFGKLNGLLLLTGPTRSGEPPRRTLGALFMKQQSVAELSMPPDSLLWINKEGKKVGVYT